MASAAELVNSTFFLAKAIRYQRGTRTRLLRCTPQGLDLHQAHAEREVEHAGCPDAARRARGADDAHHRIRHEYRGQLPPPQLAEVAPVLSISDFTEVALTLSMPSAPTISYGVAPAVPSVNDVAVPGAPTLAMPALPSLLSVNTVPFGASTCTTSGSTGWRIARRSSCCRPRPTPTRRERTTRPNCSTNSRLSSVPA